ncbi:hypothetical protein MHH56_09540 [Paenibacillus sp. FSL K6-3182]|uniref:hypothetical protein n=1 Tax=Paenibacillus sp. FSL K6-3182 TaxID=2921495 RepID=UPI0030D2BFA8
MTTEKGTTTSELGKATVSPESDGSIGIRFITEKSEAQSLTIFNLQFFDKDNLPASEPFKLLIPLQ